MGWLLKKKDKLKENINLKADDFSKIKRINSIDEIIEEKNIKPLNEVSNINHDYKLPSSELLKSNESRSLLPFIEKIINRKEIIIPLGLNKNEIIVESLNKMPNLLIGGTVMSGKTAFINTIISTILLTKKPWEVKLIIYDYKNVDYAQYNGIPHLLCPVITDKMKLAISLKKFYCEIEKRLELLNKSNSKNIDIYNSSNDVEKKLPYYIIIIDDYSSVCNFDEIDNLVESITRMGWNVGIYVILTTNHPSAKVIPTVSKSNFPARLSFRVASCKASQIIIDKNGAESLKLGEALYKSRYTDSILKLAVPYISDDDINSIINWCMKEQAVFYQIEEVDNYEKSVKEEYDDPIYNEVLEFVIQFDKVSSSLIQRKFRIGYNRVARILDLLEERGIVGPNEGNSLREVLIRLNNKT